MLDVLPTKHELLLAITGHNVTGAVCEWARELAALHAQRGQAPERVQEIDCRRTDIVTAIDDWLSGLIPHLDDRNDMVSVGALIDHAAAAANRSLVVLATDGANCIRMHEAWTHLGELELMYDHLLADLTGRPATPPPRIVSKCHCSGTLLEGAVE
ncbi:hypothetical protein [Nocardia sp. R6R-6]|uniref:hypothetical protein n=1 Tax=Nocardia sp. R6R-6 TaxID=3459303 RepID=UPI00403E254D